MRKRVAFFTYPKWAFGTIHSMLCKELYRYGIDADIIDWSICYTVEEFNEFNKIYDIFISTTDCLVLFRDYGIPMEKIICVAHGRYDIDIGIKHNTNFNAFLDYAVISQSLADYSKKINVPRTPKILRNGISFDRFYQKPAKNLNKIGYAGAMQHLDANTQTDCKRSHLVTSISEQTGIPIHFAGQRNFITMPTYYSTVDCVIVSSDDSEACGLPLMEAAAAGRLPISPKIGITSEFDSPPGVILPLDEKAFVRQGVETIKELVQNPAKFRKLCTDAQDFARENYDWKSVIEGWAHLILSN